MQLPKESADVTKEHIADNDAIAYGSIRKFIETWPTKTFEKGQTIWESGESPDYIYCLKAGFARSYSISDRGDIQVIWYGRPEDIFPLPSLFSASYKTPYYFDAFTDCEVYAVPQTDFKAFLRTDVDALLRLSMYLAEDNLDTSRRLHALSESKASAKVLRILDFFARRFNVPSASNAVDIAIPLTHQDIANFIGLARETVSHELSRLKATGAVSYDAGDVTIHKKQLAALLDD